METNQWKNTHHYFIVQVTRTSNMGTSAALVFNGKSLTNNYTLMNGWASNAEIS